MLSLFDVTLFSPRGAPMSSAHRNNQKKSIFNVERLMHCVAG